MPGATNVKRIIQSVGHPTLPKLEELAKAHGTVKSNLLEVLALGAIDHLDQATFNGLMKAGVRLAREARPDMRKVRKETLSKLKGMSKEDLDALVALHESQKNAATAG